MALTRLFPRLFIAQSDCGNDHNPIRSGASRGWIRVLAAACVAIVVAIGSGCTTGRTPTLTVLGVSPSPSSETNTVFLQVTNSVGRPLRISRLDYAFASAGEVVDRGQLQLIREIPSGEAVVLEVPLPSRYAEGELVIAGSLVTSLDSIVTSYPYAATVAQPTVDVR